MIEKSHTSFGELSTNGIYRGSTALFKVKGKPGLAGPGRVAIVEGFRGDWGHRYGESLIRFCGPGAICTLA